LWWRDYFGPKKSHHGCWVLGFTWVHTGKINRIEIYLESLAGQRNRGGKKRNKNRGAAPEGDRVGILIFF